MSGTLFRLWKATVGEAPSAPAVLDIASGRRWTRAQLAEAAERWAKEHFADAGASARSRVVMSVPNGAEWFQVFLGLLSAGAVPAPIDPSEPEEAQIGAARAIGAALLWRGGRLQRVPGMAARRAPRGECLVKVTSGTSGAPKALGATDAQMEADGRQICAAMGIGPDDANLALIPLGYSYGLGNLVLPLVLQGTRVICSASALPHAVAADAKRHRPSVMPAVPPILRALATSELAPGSLSSLRLVVSAGSPLDPEVARLFLRRHGIRIHGFYGTSETGGIAFDRTGEATLSGRSVGPPLGGVRLSLRRDGGFSVSSPAVLGKGRFSPADRGELNALGELVLLGRTDRVVKVAGRRVDLAEVEQALRSLPGVNDAFVHAPAGGEPALAAAVASRLPVAELRRLLRRRLAPWKMPRRILALARLPATARGKADARRLIQLLSAPLTATSISTLSSARQISAPR
ncbi:MAG: class I adenylate-forming enzyme family protein [Opitutaceae bacterium]|jgi:acyl-coenzyme A synthetase/AMP-(fatty) acid ligase